MHTQCNPNQLVFQGFGELPVSVDFDGGAITSDAGALLVAQVDRAGAILSQFAACFEDRREQGLVIHSLESMLRQRVLGLCLGYEDINDHEQLRYDPLIQMLCRNTAPPRAGEREACGKEHAAASRNAGGGALPSHQRGREQAF